MEKRFKNPILGCLILAVVTVILSNILLPFIVESLYGSDAIFQIEIFLLVQVIGYLVPISLLLYLTESQNGKFSLYNLKNLFGNIKTKYLILSTLMGIIIFICTKTFAVFLQNFLISIADEIPTVSSRIPVSFLGFLLLIIAHALMPSLIEETMHRGIFYQSANNHITAFLLSVLPFALLHDNIINFASAFILGSILFIILSRSKNIVYLYIIHFIHNILSLVFSNFIILPFELQGLAEKLVFPEDFLMYALIALGIFIFSLILVVILLQKYPQVKKDYNLYKYREVDYLILLIIILFYGFNFLIKLWD